MMDEQVLPRIAARRGGGPVVRARLLRTFGMGESTLDDELAGHRGGGRRDARLPHRLPGQLPAPGRARGRAPPQADAKLAEVCAAIRAAPRRARLRRGRRDARRRWSAGCCASSGLTLAVAESCTGGLIAEQITDVPGASAYFLGGVVAYANAAKTALLGVPEALLARHGAVSDAGRARHGRGRAGALRARTSPSPPPASPGPGGGTPEKPVGPRARGARRRGGHARRRTSSFPLDRTRHRQLTAQLALDWVRRALLGVELVGPTLMRGRAGAPAPKPAPAKPQR